MKAIYILIGIIFAMAYLILGVSFFTGNTSVGNGIGILCLLMIIEFIVGVYWIMTDKDGY